jgi:hypothetical protein
MEEIFFLRIILINIYKYNILLLFFFSLLLKIIKSIKNKLNIIFQLYLN